MATQEQLDDLVGLPGLVLALRLPRKWLQDEAAAGRIPCLQIGRKRLFSVQAVKATLAARAARGAASTGTPIPPMPEEVRHARA